MDGRGPLVLFCRDYRATLVSGTWFGALSSPRRMMMKKKQMVETLGNGGEEGQKGVSSAGVASEDGVAYSYTA